MFDDLKDKVVVVTGGVTGIGGAASLAFAAAGAKVFAQYLGGGPELKAIEQAGIATLKLDLTQPGAPQQLIDAAVAKFGRIDVLVNNAGSLVARIPVTELDDGFIDKVFDLNCRQLIHCCRIAAVLMKAQGSGNIINVTSIAARNGASPGRQGLRLGLFEDAGQGTCGPQHPRQLRLARHHSHSVPRALLG